MENEIFKVKIYPSAERDLREIKNYLKLLK